MLLNKPINYRVISQFESSCDVIHSDYYILYGVIPCVYHDVPGPQSQPWIAAGW